jgi:hypothetical protein
MKNKLSLASLAATMLLMASTAFAQVPPPPGNAPGADQSPATGRDDAPMPAPGNRNTSVRHPDWRVGNTLTDDWYESHHGDIYYFQQHVKHLKDWSHNYNNNIYYYSDLLDRYLDQYFFSCYQSNGSPRWYSYGRCTRGDFNYYYYYYLRPIYFRLLRHSADYYREYHNKNGHQQKVREYKGYMHEVVYKYHHFTKCNYGFNGDDTRAADDNEAANVENDLGADL